MIRRTFCHIPGVGCKTEQYLWEFGIHSWQDYISSALPQLAPKKGLQVRIWIEESIAQHQLGNAKFFADLLPSEQIWRLYPDSRATTAYLDIETTGLSPKYDSITTIVLYDGKSIKHYVKGQNLPQFRRDIREYNQIVTYNGKCFDFPFIEAKLGTRLDQVHIDLRYILHSLGIVGGLKKSERRLGIRRDGLEDVDGYIAVLLWDEYKKRRNHRALETLLAYNTVDAVNLEALAVHAFNRKLKGTPFLKEEFIRPSSLPTNPFRAYSSVIKKVRRQINPSW